MKEILSYFKEKNHESKENYKNFTTITTRLESVHTVAIICAIAISVTLSITGVELVVVRISAGDACALSLRNKVINRLIPMKTIKKKTISEV